MKNYISIVLLGFTILINQSAFSTELGCLGAVSGKDAELDQLLEGYATLLPNNPSTVVCGYHDVLDGFGCPLESKISVFPIFDVRYITPLANLNPNAKVEDAIQAGLEKTSTEWKGKSIDLAMTKSYLKNVIAGKCHYTYPLPTPETAVKSKPRNEPGYYGNHRNDYLDKK